MGLIPTQNCFISSIHAEYETEFLLSFKNSEVSSNVLYLIHLMALIIERIGSFNIFNTLPIISSGLSGLMYCGIELFLYLLINGCFVHKQQ